jgi:hypothetical protein
MRLNFSKKRIGSKKVRCTKCLQTGKRGVYNKNTNTLSTCAVVQAKLQQLEGIPVSQQHLLYNSRHTHNHRDRYYRVTGDREN